MIEIHMTWEMILAGIAGSLPGIALSHWLGYREGKKAAEKRGLGLSTWMLMLSLAEAEKTDGGSEK